ncbi:MAG: SDR family oxidoreductase [Pseudomonadota bacterium]
MTSQRLAGKNAIVSGGSRGIGRGIALALASEGADIAFCHFNDHEKAKETVKTIEGMGRKAYAAECDVSSVAAIKKFYAAAKAALGDIDILVNNAGHNITEAFEDISEESFDRMLDVHVKGTFFMAQEAYRDMIKRGSGRIINITSQLAYKGAPTLTHYCAAKGANATLTKALALESAGTGVLVNAVAPGVTNTDLLTPLADELLDTLKAAIPLHRFAEVEEIAPAVVLLATPEGSFFHGSCISPNGGEVMF